MNKLLVIYNTLKVKDRIPNQHKRYMFLHHQWGYKQADIAACEGKTQSYVSKKLKEASQEITNNDIMDISAGHFTIDDIKALHYLPREQLTDYEFMTFVTDILELDVKHPLFVYWTITTSRKIAALSSLGIQNGFLSAKYDKTAQNISMIAKRNMSHVAKELPQRYAPWSDYRVYEKQSKRELTKFVVAGGIVY